jgi:hypothetical protein
MKKARKAHTKLASCALAAREQKVLCCPSARPHEKVDAFPRMYASSASDIQAAMFECAEGWTRSSEH